MTITGDDRSGTLVTVDEAAGDLDIRANTIRKWIQRGHLRHYGYREMPEARPRILINPTELRAFLESRVGAKVAGKLVA